MAGVIGKQDLTQSQQRLFVNTFDEVIETLRRIQLTLLSSCVPWSQRSARKRVLLEWNK